MVNVVVPARAAANFGVVATAGAVTAGRRTASRRIAGTGFPLKSANVRPEFCEAVPPELLELVVLAFLLPPPPQPEASNESPAASAHTLSSQTPLCLRVTM